MVKVAIPPPETVAGPEPGGGSEWTELIKARHDIDAHLLTGRLEEAGIETRSVVDRGAPGAWLYGGSNPWAPVTVMVRRFQLEDARIVLAEISFDGPSATELAAMARGRRASYGILWWVTALLLGLALTVIVLGQIARAATTAPIRSAKKIERAR